MWKKVNTKIKGVLLLALIAALLSGCGGVNFNLWPDRSKPLKERVLEGKGEGKVAIIPITGLISESPRRELIGKEPSVVQEVVAQLRVAEKDPEVKAILLKVASPGGTVTASDLLYHEIMAFKERKKAKIIVMMMDTAASGGYYVSLPADVIYAHPTTVTGSVGVIFMRPTVTTLMDKLGVTVEINKTGKNKDMGSPFRMASPDEKEIFSGLIDKMGKRFLTLVSHHRKIETPQLAEVASARIYLAEEALSLKLIDKIGYLPDALLEAKKQAGLAENAKVVIYRRSASADENIYSLASAGEGTAKPSLIDLPLTDLFPSLQPGFYFLWAPGLGGN
jgi:protease IV